MTDREKENVAENVIQAPWKRRKVKLPDESAIELQEKLSFAEELTQTVIVQMMHTLSENNIDIGEKGYIRDMGLIIELTKGSIYRSVGLFHPTQKLLELLVDVTVDPDNSVHSELNSELMEEYIYLFDGDDDDPIIS